jgi:hypothetical protein
MILIQVPLHGWALILLWATYILDGSYRLQVLQSCHNFLTTGHFGLNKTRELILRNF